MQTLTAATALSQTITFNALTARTYGDAAFAPGATASSGLTVGYTSSNTAVATVSDTTVTITGAGTTTITASQAGNATYSPAPDVSRVLTVNKGSQTITFSAPSTKTYGAAPFAPGATSSSGLAVTYSNSNTNVAMVSGSTVTITGVGTTTITASQAGNANFNAATDVARAQVVNAAAGFQTWAVGIETANGLAIGTLANNPSGDQDHDGRSNLIEYAFGSSPVVANDAAPHLPALRADPGYYVLRYQRDTSLGGLTFTAQASTNFTAWKAPGETGAPTGFTDTVVSTNGTLETHEAKIPRSSGNHIFFRVKITST